MGSFDGATTRLLRADKSGRLSLALKLGPQNPYQEYSAQAETWLASPNLAEVSGQEPNSTQGRPVYTTAVVVSSAHR